MDTVGYISFQKSSAASQLVQDNDRKQMQDGRLKKPGLVFHYANIDGNTVSLAQVCANASVVCALLAIMMANTLLDQYRTVQLEPN